MVSTSTTLVLRSWWLACNHGGGNESGMCDDRRAFFQKISLVGKEPKVAYSINPTAWQWWLWLGGRLAAVVIGLWVGISFVAGQVFDKRLYDFHQMAKPQIETFIESEITNHEDGHVTEARIDVIERHNTGVDIQLEGVVKQLDKMDKKLDVLILNGSEHDS